jgi:hypothetical protein
MEHILPKCQQKTVGTPFDTLSLDAKAKKSIMLHSKK